jgi:hypothetical protein
VALLGPPQQPQPLGRLVRLPSGGPQRVLGQHQPLPGGSHVPPTPPAPSQGRDLVAGGLPVGVGVSAGLLGLGRPPGGQLQLPGAIRRTARAELGQPVTFGPQLTGGQPAHIHHIGGVGGQGLAAVTAEHPP